VERTVRRLLKSGRPGDFAPDRPLQEMGLDSLNLLELTAVLSAELGVSLDATVFFRHPTPRALADHCRTLLGGGSGRRRETDLGHPHGTPCPANEPIAVIGMGCRFPGGADRPEAFWSLLARGIDAVAAAPADRWDVRDAPPACGWGGFLSDVDAF